MAYTLGIRRCKLCLAQLYLYESQHRRDAPSHYYHPTAYTLAGNFVTDATGEQCTYVNRTIYLSNTTKLRALTYIAKE